ISQPVGFAQNAFGRLVAMTTGFAAEFLRGAGCQDQDDDPGQEVDEIVTVVDGSTITKAETGTKARDGLRVELTSAACFKEPPAFSRQTLYRSGFHRPQQWRVPQRYQSAP